MPHKIKNAIASSNRSGQGRLLHRSRSAIYVFTIPIPAFTMSDLSVHDEPIQAFTMDDPDVHDGSVRAGSDN